MKVTAKTIRPTQIKLCGLRREEDIRIVNEVMPEYAGFILAEGRRRSITPERMRELTSLLAPGILRVAVFLDQDPEWICLLAKQDLMDVIQLHGFESDDVIRMLQRRTGKKIIKVIRIDKEQDTGTVHEKACPADLILLDHGAGGSGEAFDWSLAGAFSRDFILAGGLTPENVKEAIDIAHPFAVDVSSGVETNHVKDRKKVLRFIENVRAAAL